MNTFNTSVPVVISLSSHDPSGGSGIQADIETCMSLGCHCSTVITAVCARDTREVKEVAAIDSTLLIEQCRAILEDMPVAAIKIGYLGSVSNVEAAHSILRDYPNVPVILDPLISLDNTESLDSFALLNAIKSLLIPMATLISTDINTLYQLAQQGDTQNACTSEVLESGCRYIFVTDTQRGRSALYDNNGLCKSFPFTRLHEQHQHTCATLSASISAYIAHGLHITEAVKEGQNFTEQAHLASRQIGMGKPTPNRIFWAGHNQEQKLGS